MKRFYALVIFIAFFGCNSENGNDCFQAEGSIIAMTYDVADFSKIRIEGEVSLIIKQDISQNVMVETGENLINDVVVLVEGETLVIKDTNYCNLFRDYGITQAVVSTPVLTAIRNSSTFDVHSDGILSFPEISLASNTEGGIENVRKGGDFYLQIASEKLDVSANGQSVFYISGMVNEAAIKFTDENPRFEGEDLVIEELEVFQRSANKMIVNPQQKIFGEIRGTGDIISLNRPNIIEVEEYFTGRLLFQD
tara:strand:+ start:119917 stop:120669 length:753 start_codon:yes stop_codon:yes gene_type:complete